jgi:glycosyltransferase involved in cell wall biosynthesis
MHREVASAARQSSIRDGLGWGDRPVILTVGRLQKRKGHDQLILALPKIRQAIPDVLYSIVGEGEERSSLESLVAREGLGDHVQFVGHPNDEELVRCYQQCDLFVLPNRQVAKDIEGFGMVLLEAQACGKPVVAGASGGTAETMRIPETGHVVPCDTPEHLADLVVKLLEGAVLAGAQRSRIVTVNFFLPLRDFTSICDSVNFNSTQQLGLGVKFKHAIRSSICSRRSRQCS